MVPVLEQLHGGQKEGSKSVAAVLCVLCFGLGYAWCRMCDTLIRRRLNKKINDERKGYVNSRIAWDSDLQMQSLDPKLSRLNSVNGGNIKEYGPVSPPSLQLCYGCDMIIPFAEYAACKLLDTTPDSTKDEILFEGIRTLAALYIRADYSSMPDCLEIYGLNRILLEQMKVTYYINEFERLDSSQFIDSPRDTELEPGMTQHLKLIKWTLQIMLEEFEAMLCEYFSWHWHQVEDVYSVNQDDLSGDGLTCSWDPQGKQRVRRRRQSSTRKHQLGSLSNKDSPDGNSNNDRAKHNWLRAKRVVVRKLTEDTLSVQRKMRTMVQILSEVNHNDNEKEDEEQQLLSTNSSDISEQQQQQRRNPVLLMLGGGMAAGKSTVREIIGKDEFWSKVGRSAIVVEADALKNQDIVYRSLNNLKSFDGADVSRMVHEYSTQAAEVMLVTAVNQQKDIVFDGTMTWSPFVEQTVAMVRDHTNNYRRGPGYVTDDDGNLLVERYWEIDHNNPPTNEKLPYRIELVGVTCDPALAVSRGIWRKLRTGRSVPIVSQLRSHQLFSKNFEKISNIVDSATLYHTGSALTTFGKRMEDLIPKVIAHRSSATKGEMLVNTGAWSDFVNYASINPKAKNKGALFDKKHTPKGAIAPCLHSLCARRRALQQIFKRATSESSFDLSVDEDS